MDGSTGNLLTEKNIMTEPMFIREYTIDGSVCDQIIEYYEKREDKERGKTWARDYEGDTYVPTEDSTVKLCTTAPMPSSYEACPQCIKDYFSELRRVIADYVKEYPECNTGSPWCPRTSIYSALCSRRRLLRLAYRKIFCRTTFMCKTFSVYDISK